MSHKTNTPLTSNSTRNEQNLQEEKLMKSNEATKYLNVHRSTLMRWYDNGTLIPIKVAENGYKYYSQKQLDIFKQEHPELCKTVAQDIKTVAQDIKTVAQDIKTVADCDIGVKSASTALQNFNPSAAPAKNDTPKSKKSTALVKIDTPIGGRVKKNDQRIVTVTNVKGEIKEADSEQIQEVQKGLFQYTHDDKRHDPNDKLIKIFFNLSDDQYHAGQFVIKEGVKNHTDVITPVSFDQMNYVLVTERPRLDQFDREVCLACISEQAIGNSVTTIDTLYHCMTGSATKRPTPQMAARIRMSILKLMSTHISFDASEVCKKFGYNSREPMIYSGSVLWVEMLDNVQINGFYTTCIHFIKRSPLFTLAELKNGQILSYEKNYLNTPVNNTSDFIPIKNYIFRRIVEINKHKLRPFITFEDIFEKNGFNGISKLQKQRIRSYIDKCFLHWVKHQVISSFQLIKKGQSPYGVSFNF